MAVPATTYADDALAYSSETIKCLERHQIELGRWLLGGSMATANAAVRGEMSWSSYEAREARSKLQYAGRLKFMANTNYSRRIYLHLRYKNIKTAWIRKYTSLNTKYNQNSKHHETKTEWRKAVIKEINDAETSIWRTAVTKKQSLALYHQHKPEPCPSPHYRGDRGSALLFQARTGALLTNQRRHELFDVDPTCRLCGAQEETLIYVLQQCPRLPPDPQPCTLAESLALTGNTEEERAARAEATKTRLEQWERQGSQTTEGYAGGFNFFKCNYPFCFGGREASEAFMTANSAAEKAAAVPFSCGTGGMALANTCKAWSWSKCKEVADVHFSDGTKLVMYADGADVMEAAMQELCT
ncbi:hypothetical protein HPB49_005477 [Dermacentor silvarum]|uniref:Uncharacterized protein n=1 Tax=Dermacentor silvarum TaxID=543639 RepID=A0ACB8DVI5_DERSI|nr:hypothetical protein HPB49_005477 [Dermacentor silvarum]